MGIHIGRCIRRDRHRRHGLCGCSAARAVERARAGHCLVDGSEVNPKLSKTMHEDAKSAVLESGCVQSQRLRCAARRRRGLRRR